ncbi:MAG: aldose 1-epimerase, partial [Kiritimatiellae bacterium]|nr:aldose 1-epimerase [Kiritimatiellia bacterium]
MISIEHPMRITASILPSLGANLVSFTVDGKELIYWDEERLAGESFMTGAFHMFPTPCRLKGCSYMFEGRRIFQRKHGRDVFIHGLIRDEPMHYLKNGNTLCCWLDVGPGHPVFEGYPFRFRFTLTYSLIPFGLEIQFTVENKDICNLPFGYGIHPFWRLHGARDDVLLELPCSHVLELADSIPTGRVTPVDGTPYDLRSPRPLSHTPVDCVLWGKKEGEPARIMFKAIATRLLLDASQILPHMIIYAPRTEPYVCVENLTSCPNAPNLAAEGRTELANLLIVPPDEKIKGWVRYTVEH